jgi:hypothetical protein
MDSPVSPARLWSTFHYGFEAESTWAGTVEAVEVRLPLSRVKDAPLVISPLGFQVQDGALRWRIGRTAAASLPPILVGLTPGEPPASKPRAANLGYAMSASSTLPPDGPHRYDASRALDGDGGTAWCEGVPGPGIGQYLEVRPRLDPALAAGCRLQGFLVIPGVALSKELWLANNRAVRLRISSCAHPEDGVDVDLEHLPAQGGRPRRFPDDPRSGADPAQFELEGDALYGPPPARIDVLQRERECFRLTILGVKRGRVDDTCIGEFVPLLTCL